MSSERMVPTGSFFELRARLLILATSAVVGLAMATTATASVSVSMPSSSGGFDAAGTGSATIRVSNSGDLQPGARLKLPVAPGIGRVNWTCAAFAGAQCATAQGSGALDESLDGLVNGGVLEYHLDAGLAANAGAFVDLAASVVLPSGARCADEQTVPCSVRISLPTGSAVRVATESAQQAAAAGQRVRYAFVLDTPDAGRSTAGLFLRAPVPKGLGDVHWTCRSTAGACAMASGNGAIEQLLGDVSGSAARFDVEGTVSADAPASIIAAAVATPVRGGRCATPSAGGVASCAARVEIGTVPRIYATRSGDAFPPTGGVSERFTIENRGAPVAATDVVMPVPASVSTMSWTCAGSGLSCPRASGSGAIAQTIANWPTSGVLRYEVTFDREPAGLAELTVTPPANARCGAAEARPPCLVRAATPLDKAYLDIAIRADRLGSAPNQDVGYTVTLWNRTSSQTVDDVVLDMPVPAGLSGFDTWTCTSTSAATPCPAGSGRGALRERIAHFAPGASLTYVVHANTALAVPKTIVARARLVPPFSTGVGCVTASGVARACLASTEVSTVPVIALEQRGTGAASGDHVGYRLDVFNLGADGGNVRIDDAVPPGLEGVSWLCSGIGASCPAASGSGKVSALVTDMPAGTGLRYDVSARIGTAAQHAITNVLRAIPQPGARCHRSADDPLTAIPCIDSAEIGSGALLELTQSVAERQLLQGGVAHYDVKLANAGQAASNVALNVDMPAGVRDFDWTCKSFAGASCPKSASTGAIAETIPSLPLGGSLVYSIRAELADAAGDRLASVARVTPPAGARCAGDACEASVESPVTVVPSAHLQARIGADDAILRTGARSTWTIDVRNLGSEVARDVHVDGFIDGGGATIESWTCEGSECPAPSGAGPIGVSIASLASYAQDANPGPDAAGRVLFRVTTSTTAARGESVKLAATVAAGEGDTCDPVDCRSVLAREVGPRGLGFFDIALGSNTFEAVPGGSIDYSFQIVNSGGNSASGFGIFTVEPSDFVSSSWTCVGSGGAVCPNASGNGPINEVASIMPISGVLTYTITANLAGTIQPIIDLTAGVTPAGGEACAPASCSTTLSIPAEELLSLSLNANVSEVVPDSDVTYTYTLTNSGGNDPGSLQASSVDSPNFVAISWTCAATGGASCSPAGSGTLDDFIPTFPIGSSVTYTIRATAASSLTSTVDFMVGVDFGFQPVPPEAPQGMLICNPPSCMVSLSLPSGTGAPPELSITKTANQTQLTPGGNVRYTIDIVNTGTTDATSVQFTDAIPNGLTAFAWSCSATGDTSCPQSSGTGPISETISFLPIDSSLTYTVDATVSPTASGTVSNRAQLIGSNIVCTPSSCQAVSALPVGQAAVLSVSKTASPASGTPVGPGQAIAWTVLASNSGGPTRAALVLTDTLPTSVAAISVQPDSGVSCNTLTPAPGSTLTCTVAAGFSGQRGVQISATVAANASGAVVNSVDASGLDNPVCAACTVSNPVAQAVDVAIANARSFSAAGIPGTLIDIANMSTVGTATTVNVSPASALRLFAAYAGGCTATAGADGSISVSCPNPPSSQGIACSGSTCTLASLPSNSAATLFVALNPGATATVTAVVPGDADPTDNTLVLPIGGTP